MKICEKCCEVLSGPKILCFENKMKFVVNNPEGKMVHRCIVDDCWITGSNPRCDFLIKVEDEVLYLIELKGTDHIRALEQIVSTAEQLNVSTFEGERKSVLVCAPCPKASTRYQVAQVKLKRRYKKAGISFPKKRSYCCEVTV